MSDNEVEEQPDPMMETAENCAALCADLSHTLIKFSLRFSEISGTAPLVKEPEEEGKKKKKKKRYVDPNAPKKPISAYVQYLQDVRAQIVEDNPDLKQTEIMTKIGNLWTNLAESKKNKYIKTYESELKRYEKEFKEYKRKNPDAGKPPKEEPPSPKKKNSAAKAMKRKSPRGGAKSKKKKR